MADGTDDATQIENEIQEGLIDLDQDPAPDPDADPAPDPDTDPNADPNPDADPDADPDPNEDPAPDPDADPAQPQEPRSNKRIRELNAKAKAEKERAEQLEKEKAELRAQLDAQARARLLDGTPPPQMGQPAQQEQLVEPKPEDFADNAAYWRALVKYEAKVEAQKTLADTEAKRQAATAMASTNATLNDHRARVQVAAEKNPEILEMDVKLMKKLLASTPKLALAVAKSDKSAQLVQYLVANASETEKMLAMDPDSQLLALGEIKGRMASVKPKTVTQAAKPVKPVGNGEAAPKKSGGYKPGDGPKAFTEEFERKYGYKPGQRPV